MNISKESTGDLTATVKLELSPVDYNEKVEKTLKDYQKKSSMPGFRPGKVPFGMVKKMYGKSVLVDEINKLVSESVTNFIQENKLNLLGEPLPNNEKQPSLDFENPENFEFYFDIAVSPEVKIDLSENVKLDFYKIIPEQSVIDGYIEDIRKRWGVMSNPDVSSAGDMINGKFEELDETGNIKEGGITNNAWLSLDYIKDEKVKTSLIGLKKEDHVVFNPYLATGNKTETAGLLGIKPEEAEQIKSEFRFTVINISSVALAELNEELFQKAYPGASIKTTDELKETIKKEIEDSYLKQSDQKLMFDIIQYFTKETNIQLPVEFLKRWLLETNKKELTAEQIDQDFEKYADSLKWQLIENKIITDGEIQVTEDEVKVYYKDYVRKMFSQYGVVEDAAKMDQRIDEVVNRALQNKEETNKIFHTLYDDKIRVFMKSKIKLIEKDISYEEFAKLV